MSKRKARKKWPVRKKDKGREKKKEEQREKIRPGTFALQEYDCDSEMALPSGFAVHDLRNSSSLDYHIVKRYISPYK